MREPLVRADHVRKIFRTAHGQVRAVEDLSFSMAEGNSVGLVGESGSGKTTTARMVVGLERPSAGAIRIEGIEPYAGSRRDPRLAGLVQMIFQDPYQSLSPRMSAGDAVAYPLRVRRVARSEIAQRVRDVFEQVGLPRAAAGRYPHQLSTGQRQRVGIARALVTRPRLIVADEPLSSVDVSLQSQILNLLADIQRETHVAYLVISHDLAVVGQLCDYVIVMQSGQVVEEGETAAILDTPRVAYTQKLLAAAGVGL
jgi:peptide/nickel transport system ATP-binding protein